MKLVMTANEYQIQESELLSKIPPELRSVLSYMAYERGHSAGYEEVLGVLQGLVSDLEKPLIELCKRLSEKHN